MADPILDDCAPGVKKCVRCERVLPLDEFRPQLAHLSGFLLTCLRCRKTGRSWEIRNKGKAAQIAKRYRDKDPEKFRKQRREGRTRRKEKIRAWAKVYSQKPHVKAGARRYVRQKWASNPDEMRRKSREWYANNLDKCRAKAKRWRDANKAKRAEQQNRREARKRAATIGNLSEVTAFYRYVHGAPRLHCYWCRKPVPIDDRHVDHIVPISRKGPHAVTNLCCSCSTCNTRKNNKLPEEFNGQYVLNFSNENQLAKPDSA